MRALQGLARPKWPRSGVIRPPTEPTRNQIWVAASVADELDDLGVRIAARARDARL